MYKQRILLALLLCSIISFSQEIVNSTPVALKKNIAVFQVVNEASKETTLFVGDKEKVKAIRLNSEMKIIDSVTTQRLNPKMYVRMIGYNENKSNTNLFWTSVNQEDVFFQQFNFDKSNSASKTYNLPMEDEVFIQYFSQNGKFYIMTILKNSNTLKFYVFDNNGKLEERNVDCSDIRFATSDDEKITLYEVLKESYNETELRFSLQKIRPENPTSLVESSKKRKCYSNGNTIVITLDSNIDYTQLITIDLDKFQASEKYINKPYIKYTDTFELNSNSFLIDKYLYQIKSSPNRLILTVKDLDNNLIKSYEASDENPIIDFKNSNYVQENGGTSSTRILDTSSQFIRKINNLNSGISCYKINDNYLATIGSVSPERQSVTGAIVGGIVGGALGSIAGSLIDAAISNPTMESYNAYANRKVVYLNGLFDKDANHIKGEINTLAFDKIRVFFGKDTNSSAQTLYKLDNSYYFGYYDNKTKEYTIRKFLD